MTSQNRHLGWVVAGLLGLGTVQNAAACAFHGYTPNPTLVDLLLATEQVVIGRPDPVNKTQYMPVETLLGPQMPDLPVSVSSDIRRHLERDPASTVLFARDGAYGPWIEIAVLDPSFRTLIDEVMRNQSRWLLGRDAERAAFFATRLDDPNPDIRQLALMELDRLPYPVLKDVRLPAYPSLPERWEDDDLDTRPIRILLSGLSGDASELPALAAGLDVAIRSEVPYLGAYATALIELGGRSAVEGIVSTYLAPGLLPPDTQEKLLEALALQYKTARGQTRRAVAREVAQIVRANPALIDPMTRQFGPQISGRLLR